MSYPVRRWKAKKRRDYFSLAKWWMSPVNWVDTIFNGRGPRALQPEELFESGRIPLGDDALPHLLLLDVDFQIDRHIISNGIVEGDSEIAPVDLSGRRDAAPQSPYPSDGRGGTDEIESHFFRHPMNR